MRIAVTGTRGQVARALLEAGRLNGVEVVGIGRPDLDFAAPATIRPALAKERPDLVVNAAAYTAVDQAEAEPEIARLVNGNAAGVVAEAARDLRIPMIHLSTDYVFDGSLDRPYRETDRVGPTGVYGASKLLGESMVADTHPDHVILRTAWVYGPFGTNFVKTMLRLGTERDEVAVVADQLGCPTSAPDLADAILAIGELLAKRPQDDSLRGVFHLAGAGEATWAAFAQVIFAEAEALGRPPVRVRAISSADYPMRARRPANSRLDCSKLGERFGLALPSWRSSVAVCVRRLLDNERGPSIGS